MINAVVTNPVLTNTDQFAIDAVAGTTVSINAVATKTQSTNATNAARTTVRRIVCCAACRKRFTTSSGESVVLLPMLSTHVVHAPLPLPFAD